MKPTLKHEMMGLLILLTMVSCSARAEQQGIGSRCPRKKILAFGWDGPRTSELAGRLDELATLPFDGIKIDPRGYKKLFDATGKKDWDRDGYAIWYERLEKGTFSWTKHSAENATIDYRELTMMLEGIEPVKRITKTRFRIEK